MHKLAAICVRRPVFATVLILSLVVVGWFAYLQLGVDRFPKIDFPTIVISTHLTGAAPEEMETDVSDKIEEAVNTISGIDQLQSISSDGNSQVMVQFVLEKDADVAAQEVRDKVNTILRDLPKDADPPLIQKFDPDSVPVLAIALSGPAPIRDITEFADKKLRRRLESISGVGQATIVGGRARQINVVVDTEKLTSLGLTTAQLVGALQTQNVQIPGGRVEQGLRDLSLRTYGRVGAPQEFSSISIMTRNGYPVKVGDVARIEDSVADAESVATIDGKPAVVMSIRKQSGTNTVEVVDRLKERVAEIQKDLPRGWKMQLVRDQSDYINAAVDAVKEHLILGSLFAALIVWFFLSSPKLIEALVMLGATMTTYTLLFGLHDTSERVANLHVSVLAFLALWVGVSVFASKRRWPSMARFAAALGAVALAAVVGGALAGSRLKVPLIILTLNPIRLAGVLVAFGMLAYFFRRSRPTLISAVAIPSSIIATFAAMRYENFTLNVITLLALTLAVGIVIDDAVVVLENIFRFMEEKKRTPREAAVEGSKEVGMAVTATSLSLIAVFLPVAFMGGIVGRFMNSFGITMAIAIAVSLLVSFTLTPMMSSRWLRREDLHHEKSTREHGVYGLIEATYLRLLDWALGHRWVIVTAMVIAVASIAPLGMVVNKNFLPADDESQFQVTARAPEGSSLETTQTILQSIDNRVRQIPEVETTVVTIGDDPQVTHNLGSIYVKLVPVEQRKRDQFAIMADVRQNILPQYARLNLRTSVAQVNSFGGGVNAEIMYWIGGPDLHKLEQYSNDLLAKLREMQAMGVVDPDTNFIVGKPELGVHIDRAKAADMGVRVQDIASTLNVLVGGLKITDYYEGGEQYEVHVRAEHAYRKDPQGIGQAEVPTASGKTVQLRDVVNMEPGSGPSTVNRISRQRQVMLTANMAPGHSSQTVMDELLKETKKLNMPSEYSSGFTGRSREQGRAFASFMFAFLLSIIFMYLILAAQFESWLHPVTILLALPLTVPFALFSILVLNQSLNIFSMLGILVLFGIVKKNGILQIDHTNQLRAAGLPRAEAIREANRNRLRPILMTTMAFVAGMLPLVVSSGTGAASNRAIGSVIIGGQTLALALTLLATPVAYSLFDDLQERLRGRSTEPVGEAPDAPFETEPEPVYVTND
jgi:multidrug efflux pump subunit AcrB